MHGSECEKERERERKASDFIVLMMVMKSYD
jgi:hypothetical protein